MSLPGIPNITPTISLSVGQTVPLLLASVALEELALAHVLNAEAEKLQLVLGTLTPTRTTFSPATVSLSNLLDIDASVQRTLRDVIKKEMLLEFKFENILDLIPTITTTPGGGGVGTLTMMKTAAPNPVSVGQLLTYTIVVSNTGTAPLTNLLISEPIPAGTNLVSTNAPAGFTTTETPAGNPTLVTFTTPSLAPLSSATITVVIRVLGSAGPTVTNIATAIADGVAPVTATTTVTVQRGG
ncbi:DUF11 domain-containing protein [Neobacillus rhizophilus]|uniref:DUF11 domain-containing protein n=1 Tax=Neobacillus rhizophilus TaxID=2833579 RepID=A0A942YU86_9BACI|nr:DUF11 domain-containing protein [Neobacillus rhizophilus]MBS4212667.1 DUF11 domain-containing protein [Neobacillus rhizophilus]MBU8915074.1 DUF11 domain-containing protein [Bacillus sp. FJAT-29953]